MRLGAANAAGRGGIQVQTAGIDGFVAVDAEAVAAVVASAQGGLDTPERLRRAALSILGHGLLLQGIHAREPVHHVAIDLRELALWDSSAVAAIDKVVGKFRRNGMEVEVMAPLGAGRELHEKLALHDKDVELGTGGH